MFAENTSQFCHHAHSYSLPVHPFCSPRLGNAHKTHLLDDCEISDDDDDNDDDDSFYTALFSALEQTHCAHM